MHSMLSYAVWVCSGRRKTAWSLSPASGAPEWVASAGASEEVSFGGECALKFGSSANLAKTCKFELEGCGAVEPTPISSSTDVEEIGTAAVVRRSAEQEEDKI